MDFINKRDETRWPNDKMSGHQTCSIVFGYQLNILRLTRAINANHATL